MGMQELVDELRETGKLGSRAARKMLGSTVDCMLKYRSRLAYVTNYRFTIFLTLKEYTAEGEYKPHVYYSKPVRNSDRVNKDQN